MLEIAEQNVIKSQQLIGIYYQKPGSQWQKMKKFSFKPPVHKPKMP
jgi:hypothetical protein